MQAVIKYSNRYFCSMNAFEIIDKYYADNAELRELLLHHGRQVAEKALEIADKHPELALDRELLTQAGYLHDVGIFLCDAPGIHCHGYLHYLCHGLAGGMLLRKKGLDTLARICERHTGTGLTADIIERQGLALPPADYRPETLTEQVICYADKFFSKSHPERTRTVEQTAQSLERFGMESVGIFLAWAERFE